MTFTGRVLGLYHISKVTIRLLNWKLEVFDTEENAEALYFRAFNWEVADDMKGSNFRPDFKYSSTKPRTM